MIVFSQIQPIESNKNQERTGKKKEPVDVLKTETKPEHGSHWQDSTGLESSAYERKKSVDLEAMQLTKYCLQITLAHAFPKSNMHCSGLKKCKYILAIQISKCL